MNLPNYLLEILYIRMYLIFIMVMKRNLPQMLILERGQNNLPKETAKYFLTRSKNPLSDKYTFSVWTKIDHQKYGLGWFKCEVKRQNGEVIYKEVPDTRRSNDIHGDWIRTEMTFPVDANCTVDISYFTTRDMIIDELLIRPDTADIIIQGFDRNGMLFNGFKVNKTVL
jgi:hypothetical protein